MPPQDTASTAHAAQQSGSGMQQPLPGSIERAEGPSTGTLEPGSLAGPFAGLAALAPIGVFDSGMGGLSIVSELRRTLPHEDIVYFGDNAYVPYGGRPDEWLRARSNEITRFLLDQGVKVVVVACNTASAAGLEHLRARYSLPIVGLVPAVKPAVAATRTGTVGVLATRATMRGRLLSDVIERFAAPVGVEVVTVAPEGLVEAVERGDLDTEDTADAVRRAIGPMIARGADAIVLGCTHYPYLGPLIRVAAGDGVRIIDAGEGVARQTERVLAARNLLTSSTAPGSLTVYTSADPDTVRPLAHRLVGEPVEVVRALPDAGQVD
ncbi:MAG TPA: glutamate racemase [Chloroflexia bacterium]|nr:glutamate racemase [Chloroflexia bacterium]